ncbi:hypothetical protein ABL78_4748 [Leptomonas seymouri]|uniref:Uncharacterized protein n=1 Tax=Leptomonas seymouri TaxID=5684 RepID=A0A0N1IJZ6_LEPSE|nr:hypothetical protein ABL78_4748 [Leptomonas seymouri]|eukprot:KPI86195.1 hypothetical protein ABL78_4748 [Leptomonas seymouri]
MMRSRSRQVPHLIFHPIAIASIIVFVVLFLALGYHTGVKHVEQAHQPRLSEIERDLGHQLAQLASCNKQMEALTSEVSRSNFHVKALRRAVKELQQEQNKIQATYKLLNEENNECELARADMMKRIEDLDLEDAQKRRKVEELAWEVEALQMSVTQITRGEGMSIVLLSEVLKTLRAMYEATCSKLPGCVELTDEDLLELRVENNRTEEIREFLERDVGAQRSLANSLQVSSADRDGIYFLPTVDEERQWDTKAHYPSYFKRTITQKPLRGVKESSNTTYPAGNVVRMLEAYSDYAMCAYSYNNSQFSFQSLFEYTPNDSTAPQPAHPTYAFLHKLIVSPLLQYCTQCDAHVWTQQYRLACSRSRVLTLRSYGTHDFWVVRSMIQAAPLVQKAALNFYVDHAIENQGVLAVVLHLSSKDREECDRAATSEYGIHYQYLMANFPDDAALKAHNSRERSVQCSPTAIQIIEHIVYVLKTTTNRFDKIYLSMSAETRGNVVALLNQRGDTELLSLLLPAYANPNEEVSTPGFTELVDLEIASRATYILVAPFMHSSRYVTEQFLLRHRLNPSAHVWMF